MDYKPNLVPGSFKWYRYKLQQTLRECYPKILDQARVCLEQGTLSENEINQYYIQNWKAMDWFYRIYGKKLERLSSRLNLASAQEFKEHYEELLAEIEQKDNELHVRSLRDSQPTTVTSIQLQQLQNLIAATEQNPTLSIAEANPGIDYSSNTLPEDIWNV